MAVGFHKDYWETKDESYSSDGILYGANKDRYRSFTNNIDDISKVLDCYISAPNLAILDIVDQDLTPYIDYINDPFIWNGPWRSLRCSYSLGEVDLIYQGITFLNWSPVKQSDGSYIIRNNAHSRWGVNEGYTILDLFSGNTTNELLSPYRVTYRPDNNNDYVYEALVTGRILTSKLMNVSFTDGRARLLTFDQLVEEISNGSTLDQISQMLFWYSPYGYHVYNDDYTDYITMHTAYYAKLKSYAEWVPTYSSLIRNYIIDSIASAIHLLINRTTTYTNSTWSTKKTWYIKTTFSKNSSSNVVNYVTMIRNNQYKNVA